MGGGAVHGAWVRRRRLGAVPDDVAAPSGQPDLLCFSTRRRFAPRRSCWISSTARSIGRCARILGFARHRPGGRARAAPRTGAAGPGGAASRRAVEGGRRGRAERGKEFAGECSRGISAGGGVGGRGTTRDVVSVPVAFDGWPVELTDTAGLREAEGLEAEGVERAKKAVRDAGLVLWVMDAADSEGGWPRPGECPMDDAIFVDEQDRSRAVVGAGRVRPRCTRGVGVSATAGTGIPELDRRDREAARPRSAAAGRCGAVHAATRRPRLWRTRTEPAGRGGEAIPERVSAG